MEERKTLLAAFTEAVAARQCHEFEWLVKAAYAAGASREDLLSSVEAGQQLGEVPGRLVALAFATVNAWQWMAARRPAYRRDLVRPPA